MSLGTGGDPNNTVPSLNRRIHRASPLNLSGDSLRRARAKPAESGCPNDAFGATNYPPARLRQLGGFRSESWAPSNRNAWATSSESASWRPAPSSYRPRRKENLEASPASSANTSQWLQPEDERP